jgi:hypothetical protein
MTEGQKKGYEWLLRMMSEHLKFLTAATMSLSLIGTGIWWAFGPRITEAAREIVGTNDLKDLVIQQGVRLDENRDALMGLTERVAAMEPSPAVAEYDVLRSDIEDMCRPNSRCTYTYRVRRTDEGESCGAPTAQRILVDAAGSTFFPQGSSETQRAQQLQGEWAIVTSSFVVPGRVVPGIAEFSLQLTYPDCDPAALGRVVVIEESPHLIFEIGERP